MNKFEHIFTCLGACLYLHFSDLSKSFAPFNLSCCYLFLLLYGKLLTIKKINFLLETGIGNFFLTFLWFCYIG